MEDTRTETTNNMMLIDSIRVGHRYRRDVGDLTSLAESIANVGLLHPVVVTPNGELIAGQRRLEACRLLGWDRVSVNVVDIAEVVRGEHDENAIRKAFLPSEMVAIARALEPAERRAAKERQGERTDIRQTLPNVGKGRARDKVAAYAGVSGYTLEKAAAVVDAAEQCPQEFGDLLIKLDATQKVDGAYKELKRRARAHAKQAIPTDLCPDTEQYRLVQADIRNLNGEIEPESIDAIITDPPYSREFLPLYEALAVTATRLLKQGGSLLVMVGQSYLPEVLALMVPHIRYHWTLAYLTPGGQSAQLFQRNVNTFWKPVLWFVNGEYKGDWVGDVAKSDMNDKRFHDWGQSESGMADLIGRFTYPGQTICDPFLGGGTTGVVAVGMNRRFVGIDIDQKAIETSQGRLAGRI